jgi:hypothetical protein
MTNEQSMSVGKKISGFKVKNFDDDETLTLSPPRLFASFDVREGIDLPKGYFVTLVLTEEDMGGLSDFLNDLRNKVEAKGKEYLTQLAITTGATIGASGGPIGVAIGAAVGFVVGEAFKWLKDIWVMISSRRTPFLSRSPRPTVIRHIFRDIS